MTIEINALRFQAILGILEHERSTSQNILVDVKIEYDFDSMTFIDYAKVAQIIERTVIEKKFELIETALHFLEQTLYKTFPTIKTLFLRITKLDILDNCSVSVSHTTSIL